MLSRPERLSDAEVAAALESGWGLDVTGLEYVRVGFGSHHWAVVVADRRWFATVDDIATKRRTVAEPVDLVVTRLRAAFTTSRCLADSGLDFVVAPTPTADGAVLGRIGERFTIALHPHIDGRTHAFGEYADRSSRLAVLDLLALLHAAPGHCRADALRDDFEIPWRDDLAVALDEAGSGGASSAGPYAEAARALLCEHSDDVASLLDRYDRLADRCRSMSDRTVITHGEPHRGNTIDTDGRVVLIDWDTCLVAPPERDLWSLIEEDATIADAYLERTGARVDPDALELYRIAWDLAEIAIYVSEFRRPHRDTDDTRTAWAGLCRYLDPTRWGPA